MWDFKSPHNYIDLETARRMGTNVDLEWETESWEYVTYLGEVRTLKILGKIVVRFNNDGEQQNEIPEILSVCYVTDFRELWPRPLRELNMSMGMAALAYFNIDG